MLYPCGTGIDNIDCITDYFTPVSDNTKYGSLFRSDMVAPLIDSRASANNPGSAHPHTTKLLVPRKGINDSWHDEMCDLLASLKLTGITCELNPPTIEDAGKQLATVPINIVTAVHSALVREWWQEATQLYHIVRGSVDLTGIYEKKDLSMIKATYFKGDLRNGPQFLQWVTSFTNAESIGEQARLISKVMNSKLPAACTVEQFGQFLSNLLIDWLAIKGNDTQYEPEVLDLLPMSHK